MLPTPDALSRAWTWCRSRRTLLLRLLRILLTAGLLLLTAGGIFRFIIGPSEGYYTSDCTDTLWWANASYESGRPISDTFGYAAILPFGGNLLMLPFLPFFGVSMTTQKLGMTLFLLLFIGAIVFFCRSVRMGWVPSALTAFVTCFVLSSSEKLLEIMWEHIIYYSLGILFLAVGLGLLFRLDAAARERNRRKTIVFAVLLFVFTLFTATNGLQSIATWIIPALFGIGMVWILEEKGEGFWRNTALTAAYILGIGMATLSGLGLLSVLSHGVGAGYADAYSTFSATDSWADNLRNLPVSWLRLLGAVTAGGEPLASAPSLRTMLRIAGALLLPLLPLAGLPLYRQLHSRNTKIAVFAHIGVTAFIVFACVFGNLSLTGPNWRLVPVIGSSLLASAALAADLLRDGLRLPARRVLVLFLLLPCLMSCISLSELNRMPFDYGRDNDLHLVAEELEERGLTKGYATFWNAQLVTLLSDNEVRVLGIELIRQTSTEHSYEPFPRLYQSDSRWYDDTGEEKTFLLLYTWEYSQVQSWRSRYDDSILENFTVGNRRILVFDGAVPLG